jgi:hypothetical protein
MIFLHAGAESRGKTVLVCDRRPAAGGAEAMETLWPEGNSPSRKESVGFAWVCWMGEHHREVDTW